MTQTLDRLFDHAETQPDAVAVVDGGQAITYAQFTKNLCQFIEALKRFDLTKGDMVAVEWFRLYPHWLFLLACEALGYRCLSFGRDDMESVELFLRDRAKLVIASSPIIDVKEENIFLFTAEEFSRITQAEINYQKPVSILGPYDPMRLQCSSGTTGKPKFMERNLVLHNFRINQLQEKDQYRKDSRLLLAYNFAVQANYGRATACLEAGGCIIHPESQSVIENLIKYSATHVTLLPTTLRQLLDLLPKNFIRPKGFTLSTFGGRIPANLKQQAIEKLADKIVESYGTNETGSICTMIDGELGYILPNVEVEVVDDHDQPVLNQTGRIRIRGQGLVDGYLDDPVNTAEKFKEDWFYPGDVGLKPDEQHLRLQGRADDLINIGGVKKLIPELEEFIRPKIHAEDFCICETKSHKNEQLIWLCIVPTKHTDIDEIKAIVAPLTQNALGQIILKSVNKIPRTSTNKIKRQELAEFLSKENIQN
ncbi:class I adenylate-forming enzyme family protein [Curvivirga sp.]|uniref:class I adenylate-forming enzyme family protein n=1 Tax=Curvivirga sp. TaxID=2856848 RepID=UPI003B5BAD24